MKNPCELCVVQACCRTVCIDKYNYAEYLNQKLRNMWPHLYSINGHRREHISGSIDTENDVYEKRLNKSHDEMSRIFSRNL